MTCREKLAIEHPEKIDPNELGGCWGCPQAYGYLRRPEYCMPVKVDKEKMCTACWDREIPGTEKIKKENEIMPTHDINAREVTKEDLLREIELAHAHIQEMEKRMRNLDKYNQYKEAGEEIKAMHVAFIDAGFSDDQAFELIKASIQAAMPHVLRGM